MQKDDNVLASASARAGGDFSLGVTLRVRLAEITGGWGSGGGFYIYGFVCGRYSLPRMYTPFGEREREREIELNPRMISACLADCTHIFGLRKKI